MTPDEQIAWTHRLVEFCRAEVPDEQGVIILTFPFGSPGLTSYLSNASTETAIDVLRGYLERAESTADPLKFFSLRPKKGE